MAEPWRVLVVDDEPDIHAVTDIAVKRRSWRGRPFKLTSAHSAREAREILARDGGFDAALVDVVMETSDAGLQLCRHIRENAPLSLRIILRTGQPGVAPEEDVLNTYDIDQYLAKTEATPDRLFSALRISLRSSQDIASSLFFGAQLRRFAEALQHSSTDLTTLIGIMDEQMQFLERKYDVQLKFVHDIADHERYGAELVTPLQQASGQAVPLVLGEPADGTSRYPMIISEPAAQVDKPTKSLLGRTRALLRSLVEAEDEAPHLTAGFLATAAQPLTARDRIELQRDLGQCADNWNVIFSLFQLQAAVVEKRVATIDASRTLGSQ